MIKLYTNLQTMTAKNRNFSDSEIGFHRGPNFHSPYLLVSFLQSSIASPNIAVKMLTVDHCSSSFTSILFPGVLNGLKYCCSFLAVFSVAHQTMLYLAEVLLLQMGPLRCLMVDLHLSRHKDLHHNPHCQCLVQNQHLLLSLLLSLPEAGWFQDRFTASCH